MNGAATGNAVVRWQDPPRAPRNAPISRMPALDHGAVALELAVQPGRWALVLVCEPHLHQELTQAARRIQNGSPRFYRPSRSYEARAVYHDGMSHLYVRAIGGTA